MHKQSLTQWASFKEELRTHTDIIFYINIYIEVFFTFEPWYMGPDFCLFDHPPVNCPKKDIKSQTEEPIIDTICIDFESTRCTHIKKEKSSGKHLRVLPPQRGEWMKDALLSHLAPSSCSPARCQYLMLMDALLSINYTQCKLRWISSHVRAPWRTEIADTTVLKVMQAFS